MLGSKNKVQYFYKSTNTFCTCFTPHACNSVLNVGVSLIIKLECLSYAVTLSCTFCFNSFLKGACISCSMYKVNRVVFSV